jgi:diguanylate cyclase (GGDEF)-like protein
MRDPRLAEIDFLMDVERRSLLHVKVRLSDREQRYGVDAGTYRDMVIGLLIAGHIGGSHLRSDGGSMSERALKTERDELMAKLGAGQPIDVMLTHAGRVQLWNLRDELLRDAELEPFGLRNKAAWERDLSVRLQWATTDEPLAIVFLDLDHFGAVNKELGHDRGDAVLRATFTLTKNFVGARGAVYRFGGEEVGILLPSTNQESAARLAEELRALIESDVAKFVEGFDRVQTASIGAAAFNAAIEPLVAFRHVDGLVRRAKNEGRNRVVAEPFVG